MHPTHEHKRQLSPNVRQMFPNVVTRTYLSPLGTGILVYFSSAGAIAMVCRSLPLFFFRNIWCTYDAVATLDTAIDKRCPQFAPRSQTSKESVGARLGAGRNPVKLSFTILAAALSLGVSRASSHRSKTDNRSGYSDEELFKCYDV